jgi:glutathione S-transferase
MITLYHIPLSFNSRRIWVALLEKNLEFETVEMKLDGDQLQPEFLKLNPFHHIPVLVDNGFRVIESLAILDYLEARYPESSCLPSDPQLLAAVKMVNMVTVNELLPAITPLTRQAMGFGEATPEAIEEAKKKVGVVLNFFEELLGEKTFFGDQQITVAEFVAGTVIPWLPSLGVSLTDYGKIDQWMTRLKQRESWQKTEPTQEMIDAFKAKMQKMMAAKKS